MKKLIVSSFIALSLFASTGYAKTESMYINGYNEEINSKTLVDYPPNIYKLISQVGTPNFEVFVPYTDSNNIGVEGRMKPAQLRNSANGGFVTVTTDKNEYSRVSVSASFDSPSISYTFTDKELLIVALQFNLPVKESHIVKDSILDSLSKNFLTKNEKSIKIVDGDKEHYIFNQKATGKEVIVDIYKNDDKSNYLVVTIRPNQFSKEDNDKILASFNRYDKERTLSKIDNFLKAPEKLDGDK